MEEEIERIKQQYTKKDVRKFWKFYKEVENKRKGFHF